MSANTCTARNGSYCCERPAEHGGMFHGKTIRFRKDGRTYQKSALWTDAYSAVRFSIPTWIG